MPSDTNPNIKGVIFDLDGVIVDTAQFHYAAWKALAAEWDYSLTIEDNEKLKGVSRKDSVAKIAVWAGVSATESELNTVAQRKNEKYLALCAALTPNAILPGISELINELHANALKVALGSASKNARFVIDKLGLTAVFDVIVDGNDVLKSKPDPEVFEKAAQQMHLHAKHCVVVEDAPAGIEAALSAGMRAVGLGNPDELHNAHLVLPNAKNLNLAQLNKLNQFHLT